MGTDFSKDITPPPLTLLDCLIDGELNLPRYYYYRTQLDNCLRSQRQEYCRRKRKRKLSLSDASVRNIKRQARTVKKYKVMARDKNGMLREVTPEDTLWYCLYVANPPASKRMHKLFRLRFRIPYSSFLNLSEDIIKHPLFDRWTRSDAAGSRPSNIKLLLLGSLRFLGRAWTLDDLYEANGISINTNRDFIRCFIEYGSTVLYKKYVIDQVNVIDISEREKLFRQAGFNGCIGSTDATHVAMLRCAQWAQNSHKGFKLSTPARTYNVTVDHSRRILGSTLGHPGTWNDKTIILFDNLIFNVHDGKSFSDYEFKLFEKDSNGVINEVIYNGVWFMCDNGYLRWSCTVPPDTNAVTYDAIRFSECLESMRKDVECFFGIMKGRFSILRYGFRYHTIEDCDKTWLTCCGLHNMLLEIDGLHKNWENGSRSNWEDSYYHLLLSESHDNMTTPFAIERLHSHPLNDDNDACDDIRPNEITNMSEYCKKFMVNGKRMVSKMPLSVFRQCLINHFHIRFIRNDIIWPKRIKIT